MPRRHTSPTLTSWFDCKLAIRVSIDDFMNAALLSTGIYRIKVRIFSSRHGGGTTSGTDTEIPSSIVSLSVGAHTGAASTSRGLSCSDDLPSDTPLDSSSSSPRPLCLTVAGIEDDAFVTRALRVRYTDECFKVAEAATFEVPVHGNLAGARIVLHFDLEISRDNTFVSVNTRSVLLDATDVARGKAAFIPILWHRDTAALATVRLHCALIHTSFKAPPFPPRTARAHALIAVAGNGTEEDMTPPPVRPTHVAGSAAARFRTASGSAGFDLAAAATLLGGGVGGVLTNVPTPPLPLPTTAAIYSTALFTWAAAPASLAEALDPTLLAARTQVRSAKVVAIQENLRLAFTARVAGSWRAARTAAALAASEADALEAKVVEEIEDGKFCDVFASAAATQVIDQVFCEPLRNASLVALKWVSEPEIDDQEAVDDDEVEEEEALYIPHLFSRRVRSEVSRQLEEAVEGGDDATTVPASENASNVGIIGGAAAAALAKVAAAPGAIALSTRLVSLSAASAAAFRSAVARLRRPSPCSAARLQACFFIKVCANVAAACGEISTSTAGKGFDIVTATLPPPILSPSPPPPQGRSLCAAIDTLHCRIRADFSIVSGRSNNNSNDMPRKSGGPHVVVFVHGFGGSPTDTRGLRSVLKLYYPSLIIVTAEGKGADANGCIAAAGVALSIEIAEIAKVSGVTPDYGLLSIIAFSLGGVWARVASRAPALGALARGGALHALITLASPHTGAATLGEGGVGGAAAAAGLSLWRAAGGRARALEQLSLADALPRVGVPPLLTALITGWGGSPPPACEANILEGLDTRANGLVMNSWAHVVLVGSPQGGYVGLSSAMGGVGGGFWEGVLKTRVLCCIVRFLTLSSLEIAAADTATIASGLAPPPPPTPPIPLPSLPLSTSTSSTKRSSNVIGAAFSSVGAGIANAVDALTGRVAHMAFLEAEGMGEIIALAPMMRSLWQA